MSIMHLKTSAVSDALGGFDTFTSLLGKAVMGRRIRQERDRTAAEYTDLIENADDRKLLNMGCTRYELYKMRDELYH
jgi:hypothetical protein